MCYVFHFMALLYLHHGLEGSWYTHKCISSIYKSNEVTGTLKLWKTGLVLIIPTPQVHEQEEIQSKLNLPGFLAKMKEIFFLSHGRKPFFVNRVQWCKMLHAALKIPSIQCSRIAFKASICWNKPLDEVFLLFQFAWLHFLIREMGNFIPKYENVPS